MPAEDDRSQYRELIDDLVLECRDGQGSVMPGWVRRGVCSTYARDHPGEVPEEDDINGVLKRLTDDDREVVARMLELAYEGGVHDTLRVLHDHELPPFDVAYEGTPFQDFMGRLRTDWSWPVGTDTR